MTKNPINPDWFKNVDRNFDTSSYCSNHQTFLEVQIVLVAVSLISVTVLPVAYIMEDPSSHRLFSKILIALIFVTLLHAIGCCVFRFLRAFKLFKISTFSLRKIKLKILLCFFKYRPLISLIAFLLLSGIGPGIVHWIKCSGFWNTMSADQFLLCYIHPPFDNLGLINYAFGVIMTGLFLVWIERSFRYSHGFIVLRNTPKHLYEDRDRSCLSDVKPIQKPDLYAYSRIPFICNFCKKEFKKGLPYKYQRVSSSPYSHRIKFCIPCSNDLPRINQERKDILESLQKEESRMNLEVREYYRINSL